MTVLVTGANGNVGRHVVEQLLGAGQPVRALSREPGAARFPAGVEVVGGDLTDPETLVAALDGVTGMHLITFDGRDSAPLRTGPRIVELAVRAGVRRVTVLWSGEPGAVEEAVRASPLRWTELQPVEFMSNALEWAGSVRDEGVARALSPARGSAVVHEADIAAVAVTALLGEGHAGRVYPLTGPEALTVPERVRMVGAAAGVDVRFEETTPEQAREQMRRAGVRDDVAEYVVAWHTDPPEEAYTVLPTVREVTGRPARTFARWAAEHAGAFRRG